MKEEPNRIGGLGIRKLKRDEEGNTVLAEEVKDNHAVSYILQLVKCGKASQNRCKKCRVEGGHGPYLYKMYRKRRKIESEYIYFPCRFYPATRV